MKKLHKHWSIKKSMIWGAAAGLVSVLFNLENYNGRDLPYILGVLFGALVGGALMFGIVAKFRNRLIFGKTAENRN